MSEQNIKSMTAFAETIANHDKAKGKQARRVVAKLVAKGSAASFFDVKNTDQKLREIYFSL